jgi:hypothetical protein
MAGFAALGGVDVQVRHHVRVLAWSARLALPAVGYEPKRLRLRIFATAGRLVR